MRFRQDISKCGRGGNESEYTKLSGILTTSNLIAASDENVPSGLDNKNYFNKIVIVAASDNNKCEYTPE